MPQEPTEERPAEFVKAKVIVEERPVEFVKVRIIAEEPPQRRR